MRPALLLSSLLMPCVAAAELTPEHQLALTSLREGERDKLQKAAGPLDEQPLYRAAFDVDPEARTVNGTVVITYFAKERALEHLYLRVTPNADRPQAVKLLHATVNGTPTLIEQPEPTLYRVKLDPVALPGTGATVEVRVQARVPQVAHGSDTMEADPSVLHAKKTEYGAFSAADEVMSLAGLVPGVVPLKSDGTPFAGPSGFGDLASYEPAHWLVSVEVPRTHAVICAGNALGEVPRPDGRVRFTYATSGARDFPIFVTKGYDKVTAEVDGVTVESHSFVADAAAGSRVLGYATGALAEFQKRFGPYPWSTFRVVEARLTGGAGGMEFPGLVTVGTSVYRGAADPLAALGLSGMA
ncbi:MAG: aminopeptidase, partial [Myxococcaceae bacterium]|nr:aminopeptidase [Myxococcaceae bacterium]